VRNRKYQKIITQKKLIENTTGKKKFQKLIARKKL